MPEYDPARASRDIISDLTHHRVRSHESIRGCPFEFVCMDGSVIDGTIHLIDIRPDAHLRLICNGSYIIEWRWKPTVAHLQGHWSAPVLHCDDLHERPGTFTLKPPSHFWR